MALNAECMEMVRKHIIDRGTAKIPQPGSIQLVQLLRICRQLALETKMSHLTS